MRYSKIGTGFCVLYVVSAPSANNGICTGLPDFGYSLHSTVFCAGLLLLFPGYISCLYSFNDSIYSGFRLIVQIVEYTSLTTVCT